MALLTITDARDIASRGRPWSVRLEYTGSNYNNQGGWSDKFPPWSLVVSLEIKRDNTNVVGFEALDKDNNPLFTMTPKAGQDFAKDYDIDIQWT